MTDLALSWAASYRMRLVIGYLLVVTLVASAWAWSLFSPLTDATIEQQSDNLQAVAQAGALVLSETTASATETTDRLTARTDLRMTIVAADGRVLADSAEDPTTMENHGQRPEIVKAFDGETGIDRRTSTTLGIEQLYVAVPASFEGDRVALRVSDSLERINKVAASSRRFGLVLLVAALLLAGIIVARLTALAAAPVERLSQAASAMARGNLDVDVPQESSELEMMSSALVDLREQMKRRLAELKAEKTNLEAVLDGLEDAVFLFHDDEIRFANHAARRLLKSPTDGWPGRRLDDARLPESIAGIVRRGLVATEQTAGDAGPDTSGRHLRVVVIPLNPTDEFKQTLVVIADVTERILIDGVRRDFVANASHELKTPVAAIHLLAESALGAARYGDAVQAVEFARQIANESNRLSKLVKDLLDLSRLESVPAPGSVTDVREAVQNAFAGHRAAADSRGLTLVFDDSTLRGRDALVAADPTDIAIALDNLLDNALNYTEDGHVLVNLNISGSAARVSVTDTGIGIPGEDLPRIFERFYRVDRARSRRSGGTGLGLALVRHVVERSGGSVEVSSQLNEGSTFTIILPLA